MFKAISKVFHRDKSEDRLKRQQKDSQRKIEALTAELDNKIKMIEELNARMTALNDQLSREIEEKEAAFGRLRSIVDELSVKLYDANEKHSSTIAVKNETIKKLQTTVGELNAQLERLKKMDTSL